MSIYEFLERLEKDPFDPELTALFGVDTKTDESEDETHD